MSKHVQDEFGLEFCPLAPSLPKNPKMTALIHVDDVMIFGGKDYVLNHFLPKVKEMLNISVNIVEKPGDKISFLMRSYLRVSDGLVVMPGSYINNMLELYELNFGPVQAQKVPADGSIRVEDGSQELDARTSSIYRSLIGMLVYVSQERMDVGFVTKELASKMAKPTTVALARLKKLLGYLKEQTMRASLRFVSLVLDWLSIATTS